MKELILEEQNIVAGGSCYCRPCPSCEEIFVGLTRDLGECINVCNSQRWAEEAVFYNPQNCNQGCLGRCFTKCDLSWQGLLEAFSGSGSEQRDLCKGSCYKDCRC